VVGILKRNIPTDSAPEINVFQITVVKMCVLQITGQKPGVIQIGLFESNISHNAVIEIILKHIRILKQNAGKPRPGKNTARILCLNNAAVLEKRVIVKANMKKNISHNDVFELRAMKIHQHKNLAAQLQALKRHMRQIKPDKFLLAFQIREKLLPVRLLVVNMTVTHIPKGNSMIWAARDRAGRQVQHNCFKNNESRRFPQEPEPVNQDKPPLGVGSAYAGLEASVHACGFATKREAKRSARLYHHWLPPPRAFRASRTCF
jgi:hypothetical protein